MPTVQVGPGSALELQQVADALGNGRKVVVITGAGISTNCGIPVSEANTNLRPRTLFDLLSRIFARRMDCIP
jgi:accessory colonization factor AcfC